MLVGNNESATIKNAGKLLVISIAMRMRRWDARRIARWSTSRASLEATGLDAAIGQVPAPYCPGGHHGQRIR